MPYNPAGSQEMSVSRESIAKSNTMSISSVEKNVRLSAASQCEVVSSKQLSSDVVGVQLRSCGLEPLKFKAGQYLDILLDGGEKRSFSIANAPRPDGIIELHIRTAGGSSLMDSLLQRIQRRDLLEIQGPSGRFTLAHDSAHPIVFAAGGTGIAPVKAMLEQAFREQPERVMRLFWGVRTSGDLYLHDLLADWAASHPNFHYTPILSEPDCGWVGAIGLVHETAVHCLGEMPMPHVYTSGPPPMVRAVRDAFLAQGLPETSIYSDLF